jgi:hypothetical protein
MNTKSSAAKSNAMKLKVGIILGLMLVQISTAYEIDMNVKSQRSAVEYVSNKLIVKFGSECCGIDIEAHKKLFDIIAKYEKVLHAKISFETLFWGKEGERNYCFGLKEMDDSQQAAFIQEVKSISSELVKVEKNVVCSAGW